MTEHDWRIADIGEHAFQRLASELAGSELHSLLLGVMRHRAASRSPKDILAQYQRDPFCSLAAVDLRTSRAIDRILLDAAQDFEALELSPLTPLGTCSSVALTDQNRVLSALRSAEVVADPTNVLALECATRLRRQPNAICHFATSQRVVRAQRAPKLPGHSQHFRIFVLSSGGTEQKDHAFTSDTLLLHIRSMLRAIQLLELNGFSFGQPLVKVYATHAKEHVGARIVRDLGGNAQAGLLDHPYYSGGIRFQIWVSPDSGEPVPLIDGGTFDWLTRLVSNRRAVFVATGVGAQLIALRFRSENV